MPRSNSPIARSPDSPIRRRPLWTCPKCGERFVVANIYHSCGRHTFEALFARSEPHVRAIFGKLAALAEKCGPVRIYPQKSRVVIQVRIRFAGGYPQKSAFVAGLLLPHEVQSPRIFKREDYGSRRYVGCYIRLTSEKDVDREVARLMRHAYKIGCQE